MKSHLAERSPEGLGKQGQWTPRDTEGTREGRWQQQALSISTFSSEPPNTKKEEGNVPFFSLLLCPSFSLGPLKSNLFRYQFFNTGQPGLKEGNYIFPHEKAVQVSTILYKLLEHSLRTWELSEVFKRPWVDSVHFWKFTGIFLLPINYFGLNKLKYLVDMLGF